MAKKKMEMPDMMEMPEYEGMIRADMIQASKDARMLNDMMYIADEMHRDHLLKDFDASIAYLADQGDEVGASILRDERARYG